MSLLVVGSVAFDSIKTPFGEKERVLGGSATYFSVAASFFTDVRVVAVVGEDFGPDDEAVFHEREIDISDLERIEDQQSFFWKGEYGYDLNVAQTLDTQLNVFAEFKPKLSAAARQTPYLFLRQHPAPVAGRGARAGRGQAGCRRHDELLDQQHARRACGRCSST